MVGPFNFDQDEANRLPVRPNPENPKGWELWSTEANERHVVPRGDLEEHILDSDVCPCRPLRDHEAESLFVHNSFDGREIIEELEAGRNLV